MPLLKETDYGTPKKTSEKEVTLTIDGFEVTVPEGTSVMRAAVGRGRLHPQALRHRQHRGLRLLPALPRGDRGPQGHAGLLHDAGGRRHGGLDRNRSAPQDPQGRDGALYLRPSLGLPDLLGERQLRASGHGGRRRSARRALRLRRREPSGFGEGRVEPLFHLRSLEMHRLLALRQSLRGNPGHFRADHRRARLRLGRLRRRRRGFPRLRMRVLRRLRPGLPDRDPDGEVGHRKGPGRAHRAHHLRLLRCRLLVQGRDAGRNRRQHGAL